MGVIICANATACMGHNLPNHEATVSYKMCDTCRSETQPTCTHTLRLHTLRTRSAHTPLSTHCKTRGDSSRPVHAACTQRALLPHPDPPSSAALHNQTGPVQASSCLAVRRRAGRRFTPCRSSGPRRTWPGSPGRPRRSTGLAHRTRRRRPGGSGSEDVQGHGKGSEKSM